MDKKTQKEKDAEEQAYFEADHIESREEPSG